jgi:predicted permease
MREWLARGAGALTGRGTRAEGDLDDEVRFHLDMLIERHVREGMSPDDARAAALRAFGGVTQMKEAYRDQRGLPSVEMLAQDARYGIRSLLRSPGFTAAALLTLAAGIGANSAIFSVVNAVLLRPLPYADPHEIVQMVRRFPGGEADRQDGVRYLFFRDHLRSVEALAAYRGAGSFNLVSGERAEYVNALEISKEYFTVFGVRPEIGQPFGDEHDRVGGPDVVILSHGFWRRHFGGDPSVTGRSLMLADRAVTILGVMPAAFDPLASIDVFLPLRPRTSGPGGGFNYSVAGRLRDGVTREQASADAATVWQQFRIAFPKVVRPNELPMGFTPVQQVLAGPIRPQLVAISGAVGLLLLIACANTANLLLARALGRGREIALRAALGAGRARIVRQLLTESVLLALAGGALGLLLAYLALPALLSLIPPGFLPSANVTVDRTVLGATLAIAIATGIVFGLAPALSLSRHNLVDTFKDDASRTSASPRSNLLRQTLVLTEVALSMLLLVAAGLLLATCLKLRAVDPGFDPRGVVIGRMSMQGERYARPQDAMRFYDEGLERLRRIPGVRAAAVVNSVPIARGLNLNVDVLDGPMKVEDEVVDWRYATLDYFRTMAIPIVAGREFTEGDRIGAPGVAIVSEEFARRYLKGVSPLGRSIRVYDSDGALEIVGVAKDLIEGSLRGRRIPLMYVPAAQASATALKTSHSYFHVNWVVRADNPGTVSQQIAEQLRAVDPRQPFAAFRTMDEIKSSAMSVEQFQLTLFGTFAGIGLLLACAGIYGLVAYSVAQRTREFGIRLALGATRGQIVRSVVRQGAVMTIGGILAGAAGAAALSKVLQNFVWGVTPLDPRTYAAVAALLLIVACAATAIPALRVVRMNPLRALRE